jgi:ABC-type oligopeptide transport system substrate-binding subunit
VKLSSTILFSLSLFFVGAGCTERRRPALTTREAKWLRWSGEVSDLCRAPALKTHPYLPSYACLTHEGITRAEWSQGIATGVPALAEKMEPIAPASWKIVLRDGLRWSDGTALSADAVVESWKLVLAKCASYPAARETFGRVVGARAACEKRGPLARVGFRAEDPRTIRIDLVAPSPHLPRLLASPAAWPFRHEAASGPFRALRDPQTKELRFFRNPRYRGEAPPLDGIRLVAPMPTVAHRVQAFLSGESDAVDAVPTSVASALGADTRLKAFPVPKAWLLILSPAAGDEKFRRALFEALDPMELAGLMRWPHRRLHRLSATAPEASAPEWAILPAPARAKEALEPSRKTTWAGTEGVSPTRWAPALRAFSAEESALLSELSSNLQFQWTKQLSLTVSPASAPAWLVQAELDPLHPAADIRRWLSYFGDRWGRGRLKAAERSLEGLETAATPEARQLALAAAEKELSRTQALILPLLGLGEYALVSSKVTGLSRDVLGNWDFRAVDLETQAP